MSKRLISSCSLSFHGIRKVSFEVRPPYLGAELLKVHFEDAHGDTGTLALFCDELVRVESIKPLQKLRKIIVNLGGINLKIRRKHGQK